MFYEIEAAQLTTAYLLEKAGLRQRVCDIAFEAAGSVGGDARDITGDEGTYEETISKLALRMYGDVPDIATWFPAFCRGPRDVKRLIGLLDHVQRNPVPIFRHSHPHRGQLLQIIINFTLDKFHLRLYRRLQPPLTGN